ncbi:MAG: DUF86 domain-containing protein [Spirochaetaceae bacterium]
MIKEKLIKDYDLLNKQIKLLEYSINSCKAFKERTEYTMEEFVHFETLCSRYSRSIDFLIRKIFRTIDEYEFENQGTLVDVVNNAHKRGLIKSIEKIRLMKDLRNTIVHEYIEENLKELFEEVMEYSKDLLNIMLDTTKYIKKDLEL